jgi:hypothetical protein
LIDSLGKLVDTPKIFIVTDEPEKIKKESFVFVQDIREYNSKYLEYKKNYYDFDFSVKRYSVKFALENKFNKIILTDTDVLPNFQTFNEKNILECFTHNSISGQVTYLFENEIQTNSMLGRRFTFYEQKFETQFDKSNMWMPEDCVQFLDIESNKLSSFLSTWDECIKIKDFYNLPNIPAGNIDEMCFSALMNNVELKNNSNAHVNLLVPNHEKWY